MPSLDLYRKMMGGSSVGQVRKNQSDAVMEQTWFGDINTKTCYLYDYWHDDHKQQLKNLHPEADPKKVEISLKVRTSSQQTYSKDVVTHHIQMMPSQEMNVDYYPQFFGDRYDAEFPVGLYVDIPDEKGNYRRWLIVGLANFYVNQFPTYEILPCDKVFDWVRNGKKINMAGVQRSQNSYNSGTYLDYKIERVENQAKLILPINTLSEKLYYNQRMIVDNKVDVLHGAEPRAWRITKIERTNPFGVVNLTLYQDAFDQHHDYIEYLDPSDPSTIVGMYADYYREAVPPTEISMESPIDLRVEITYVGKAQIRVDGGRKKLTVQFFDGTEAHSFIPGTWTYEINGENVNDLVVLCEDTALTENEFKIQFNGDMRYIGEILKATYITESGLSSSIELKIGG